MNKITAEIENWIECFYSFETSTLQNKLSCKVEKFAFLEFLLCDQATTVVEEFPLIVPNYDTCTDLI